MPKLLRPRSRRPGSGFDPRMLGAGLKVWLDVSGQTDSGTLTVPDRMGGPSATQATGIRKPTVGTTGNGLTKMTSGAGTNLVLPISAGIIDPDYFGIAMWMRPIGVTSGDDGDMFAVVSGAGNASANRIQIRCTSNDLKTYLYNGTGGIRSGGTTRAITAAGVWKFMAYEYVGALSPEAQRSTFRDMGTAFAAPQVQTFTQEVATAADMPTTLNTATGNAIVWNRGSAASNGFKGDVTDVFIYDPRALGPSGLVALAQYEVPIG